MNKWFNLYSTELKFNVTLKPSKIAYAARYFVIGLIAFFFFFICFFAIAHLPFSYNVLASIIMAISAWVIIPRFPTPFKGNNSILLTQKGEIICSPTLCYLINPQSRIFPWGCMLILDEVTHQERFYGETQHHINQELNEPTKKQIKQNIFKDSVSDESFRRLARTVNYVVNKTVSI